MKRHIHIIIFRSYMGKDGGRVQVEQSVRCMLLCVSMCIWMLLMLTVELYDRMQLHFHTTSNLKVNVTGGSGIPEYLFQPLVWLIPPVLRNVLVTAGRRGLYSWAVKTVQHSMIAMQHASCTTRTHARTCYRSRYCVWSLSFSIFHHRHLIQPSSNKIIYNHLLQDSY